ncbi:hypothetical protein IVB12_04360 [Bradyrhizobium sp. 179]|nr:hypothetical protein [Bradyrhizobium sp. 179]
MAGSCQFVGQEDRKHRTRELASCKSRSAPILPLTPRDSPAPRQELGIGIRIRRREAPLEPAALLVLRADVGHQLVEMTVVIGRDAQAAIDARGRPFDTLEVQHHLDVVAHLRCRRLFGELPVRIAHQPVGGEIGAEYGAERRVEANEAELGQVGVCDQTIEPVLPVGIDQFLLIGRGQERHAELVADREHGDIGCNALAAAHHDAVAVKMIERAEHRLDAAVGDHRIEARRCDRHRAVDAVAFAAARAGDTGADHGDMLGADHGITRNQCVSRASGNDWPQGAAAGAAS